MKRTTPLKRTEFKKKPRSANQEAISQGMRSHWKKRRASNPLKDGCLGESSKGYKQIPRDREHMARVAALGCRICGGPAQFHHIDILTPKGMGPKVSDYIGAGLCERHHTGDQNDCAHVGEREFWKRHGIDISAWIVSLLTRWYFGKNEGATAAIVAIEARKVSGETVLR